MTKMRVSTYHNGNEMSVIIRKWSITPKDEMLGPEEMFQIRWMRGHYPRDMIQPVVLQESVHQQHMRLQQSKRTACHK